MRNCAYGNKGVQSHPVLEKRRLYFYPCVETLICCINVRTILLLIPQFCHTHTHTSRTRTSNKALPLPPLDLYVTLGYTSSFLTTNSE